MACPSLNTLSNTTEFGFSCVLANIQNNKQLHNAMVTCCTPSKVYDLDNSGCTSSCNITAEADAIFWDFCLSDTLSPDIYTTIDQGCFIPNDVLNRRPNISATGIIATTWTAQNKEFTTTVEDNGVNKTLTETMNEYSYYVSNSILPSRATTSGSSTVASSTGSLTTGASTTGPAPKSTGTSSAPSATTSLSGATTKIGISKLKMAALGGLVLFLLLA